MKHQYTEKFKSLVRYIEVETQILENLSGSPIELGLRFLDALIVISKHFNEMGFETRQPRVKDLPLIVKLALENFISFQGLFDDSVKKNPKFLAKSVEFEQVKEIKQAITEERIQASQLFLSKMPKLKEKPSLLTAEQKKIFLNMLNVLLVNVDSHSHLGANELNEMIYKGIHQIKRHAQALGLAEYVFEKERDLAIRFDVLETYRQTEYGFGSEFMSRYPVYFSEKQSPLTSEEMKEATRILLNKDQSEIVDKLNRAFEMHADKMKENKLLLNALIEPLRVSLKSFIETGNLIEFKKAVIQTLKDSKSTIGARAEPSIFKTMYNAVVLVLRAFFRIFDHIFSALTFREKLMRDTQTPLAMRVTGKMHFFNYCDNPLPEAVQAKGSLETLKSAFDKAIEKFEQMDNLGHQHILALN